MTQQKVATASTREVFGRTLLELGKENPDIVVLGGDLNKSTNATLFAKEFPLRFFDLGAAEQNMMGVAAGLASAGKVPFCSTFAVFGTGRPFDQIRVSIAQPNLNVKIVCTHAGIITGEDGMSAHSIEDLSLMCSLPTFTVIAPADGPETVQAVRAAAQIRGPVYIRLYRPATPIVHEDGCHFQLGVAEQLRDGEDVTIAACGTVVAAALEATATLQGEGITCRVLNVHTLKPLDEKALKKAAQETGAIVTVEEHYVHGGLGSVVAQAVTRHHPVPVESIALAGYAESGKASELLERYGLTATHIATAVRKVLRRKR